VLKETNRSKSAEVTFSKFKCKKKGTRHIWLKLERTHRSDIGFLELSQIDITAIHI